MKVVYVAGAFNAPTEEERESNVKAAAAAGLSVISRGAAAFVPHLAWGGYYGRIAEPVAMAMCKEMVARADAIYVFDERHLSTSRGTWEEAREAHALGIRVLTSLTQLDEWIRDPTAPYRLRMFTP